jgi:hypothetical protein
VVDELLKQFFFALDPFLLVPVLVHVRNVEVLLGGGFAIAPLLPFAIVFGTRRRPVGVIHGRAVLALCWDVAILSWGVAWQADTQLAELGSAIALGVRTLVAAGAEVTAAAVVGLSVVLLLVPLLAFGTATKTAAALCTTTGGGFVPAEGGLA